MILGPLILVGLIYMGCYLLFMLGVRRWVSPSTCRALRLAVVFGLVSFILATASFDMLVEYFAHDPPGNPNPYRGHTDWAEWMAYRSVAQAALYGLYVGIALLITASGYGIGRIVAKRGRLVAFGTLDAVAAFAILTLPLTEFGHACMANVTLVLRMSC